MSTVWIGKGQDMADRRALSNSQPLFINWEPVFGLAAALVVSAAIWRVVYLLVMGWRPLSGLWANVTWFWEAIGYYLGPTMQFGELVLIFACVGCLYLSVRQRMK